MKKFALTLFSVLLLWMPPSMALSEESCVDRQAKRKASSSKSSGKASSVSAGPEKPKQEKPLGCLDCTAQSPRVARKILEEKKIRSLYQDPWIRAQAKRRVLATGSRNAGQAELECLIHEEFRKWNNDSGGSGGLSASAETDLNTCTIEGMEALRESKCEWNANHTFAHESSHLRRCKAQNSPTFRWNDDCVNQFPDGDKAMREQCADRVIDDIADMEAAGYDQGIANLRLRLAQFRKECATNTSMDDILLLRHERDKVLLEEAFRLLTEGS